MRKSIFISALALMSAIAFTSCMKENFEQAGESQNGNSVNFTINTGSSELKSYVEFDEANGKYIPKWHKGDALGAYFVGDGSPVPASFTNANEDGTKASFTGTAAVTEGDYKLYAVYPARAVQGVSTDMVAQLEFPYIQFPSATSFDPKADILVNVPHDVTIAAEQTDVTVDNMRFRRVGSIVKVILSDRTGNLAGDKIKSVRLESDMPGVALSGVFNYDYKTEEAAGMSVSKNHVTADLTRLETPLALNGQNAVYMMVPPCTLDEKTYFTITVKTDNYVVTKTLQFNGAYQFPSSQIVTLNISLDDRCKFEKVYFEDSFDWLYSFIDIVGPANFTDPVGDNTSSHQQPNIWSSYSDTIGEVIKDRGYEDLNKTEKTLYIQDCYFKMGAGGKQTGLRLPRINFEVDTPVDVLLTFDWCAHMSGYGNIDNVPLVVCLEEGGVCADSNEEVSNEFITTQVKGQLEWQQASIVLKGVTKDTRIVIKPNFTTYAESGNHRWHIDNIKIIKSIPQPQAEFPVKWSMKPQDELILGIDYLVGNINNGAYLYSDNHQGKLTVVRESETDCNPSTYQYRTTDQTTSGTLLHYGMSKEKYWLFEINNVNNPAGTYNIQYQMTSSGGGPKFFRLEYSTDGGQTWAPINPKNEEFVLEDGETKDTFDYTYSIESGNKTCVVDESFTLGELNKKLMIRAIVASNFNVNLDGKMGEATTATNRIYGYIKVNFSPSI